MRKIIFAAFLALILFTLCACNANTSHETSSELSPTDSAPKEINEIMEYTDGMISVQYPSDIYTNSTCTEVDGYIQLFSAVTKDGTGDNFSIKKIPRFEIELTSMDEETMLDFIQEHFPFACSTIINNKSTVVPREFEKKDDMIKIKYYVTHDVCLSRCLSDRATYRMTLEHECVIVPIDQSIYFCDFTACISEGSKGVAQAFSKSINSVKAVS